MPASTDGRPAILTADYLKIWSGQSGGIRWNCVARNSSLSDLKRRIRDTKSAKSQPSRELTYR